MIFMKNGRGLIGLEDGVLYVNVEAEQASPTAGDDAAIRVYITGTKKISVM